VSSKHVRLPTDRARASSGCGYSDGTYRYWRDVTVDDDGTVRALDPISQQFSRHHDLTKDEENEARRMVGAW